MKYKVVVSHRFKKSLKKISKSGSFDMETYHKVTDMLEEGMTLPYRYYDHSLQGDWNGYRECHIESDLLLIYSIDEEYSILSLVNIGSHSDLFG